LIGDAVAGFRSRQVEACALFAYYCLEEMPMIVMPGNNASGYVHDWAGRQPQQLVGHQSPKFQVYLIFLLQ
jgi:hypothetical protein